MGIKSKILYFITKGNFGGAQRHVYDLVTHLSKATFDIVVACGDKDGDTLQKKLSEKNIRVIKIKGLEREIKTSKDFKVLKNLIKIIKEEKPNVIHLNSSKIGVLGSLAVLYLKIVNCKLKIYAIFTAHGWAFNEKNRSAISKFIYYLGHYLTILICDTTIAVSEKARKDAPYMPFIKNKIKVIYNGIERFETLPREESRIILASKDFGKTIIFSISELHKNKGVDIAFKALSLLPLEIKEKIIYSIASGGEEERGNLEKLAINLNIRKMIRFLGFIPDAKKLLTGADIFLLPSRTEAFPYAILEAGMARLPVVATNVGGLPEIICDMQNGILVHPQNPKEIAEAILYLLDHPQKQKEFGMAIKQTVMSQFSLNKMLRETINIYKN